MARHNEIYVGHFNRFVQKFTGIKGGPPSPQLSGDFQPVIPVFVGNECRYLSAWQQYGGRMSQPAVAANQGGIQITNPVNSNVVGVIYRCFLSVSVAGAMVMSFQQAASGIAPLGSTIGPSASWDSRASLGSATLLISSQAAAGNVVDLQSSFGVWNLATANQSQEIFFDEAGEFPLLPSTTLRIRTGAVNTGFDCTFWWRERFLEESERS